MLIASEYLKLYKSHTKLSNDEYLVHHIWYIENLFTNELALLKNHKCEFIAFTKAMSMEFNLGTETLGKTFNTVTTIPEEVRNEIYKQELKLLQEKKAQTSLYFYKKNDIIYNYIVKKRPIINPATNDAVGILVNTEPVIPNVHRKFILKEFLGLSNNVMRTTKPNLLPIQKQVLFCLILGISSRKEIADTLSTITNNYITENQIKNALQNLYNIFNCSNSSQLVALALNNQIPFELPELTIPVGNYII